MLRVVPTLLRLMTISLLPLQLLPSLWMIMMDVYHYPFSSLMKVPLQLQSLGGPGILAMEILPTFPNPSHTYTSVGRYEVSLTILDAEGCQATISGDSIFVGEQIDVDFIYDVNEACIPDAIITTNLSGPTPLPEDISWIWEFGDGGTSSMREPIYQYGDTGVFDVS